MKSEPFAVFGNNYAGSVVHAWLVKIPGSCNTCVLTLYITSSYVCSYNSTWHAFVVGVR